MSAPGLTALTLAGLLGSAVSAQAQARQLPDGPGKEQVQAQCSRCHAVDRVMNYGNDQAGWEALFSSMVTLPEDQKKTISGYLAKSFPSSPKPPAVIVPGPATVSIKEWVVPSLGSRPHDPLATPDGAIWWTGQWANVLGRLDPRTGTMREYTLKSPKSMPHGLVADKAGNIWYTGNGNAHVGKLDPKTGEVTEYKMPDPAARDPHSPAFDNKGNLWFTLQGANMIGRVVPSTGQVSLASPPSPKTNPYGIMVDSKDTPWFVQFNVNKIASIDPNTMAIKEFELPNADTRPRRLTMTPEDIIWYTDYSRGYIGKFDTKTGKMVAEYPSPSGRRSLPYGITTTSDGVVWYSESGVTPNTLVRFDPKTERFQSWAIPSGGGVVRFMTTTTDGKNLAMACSGVNRIAFVEVGGTGKTQ
jgi:virginiamycin B lyase